MARIDFQDIGGYENYRGKRSFRVIDKGTPSRGSFVPDEAINARRRAGSTVTRGELRDLLVNRHVVYVLDLGSKGQNTERPSDYTWWRVGLREA